VTCSRRSWPEGFPVAISARRVEFGDRGVPHRVLPNMRKEGGGPMGPQAESLSFAGETPAVRRHYYVCLKKRLALSQRSFFWVSGVRVDQARMLSIEFGNWHSECG
jgi:hypothetical protein